MAEQLDLLPPENPDPLRSLTVKLGDALVERDRAVRNANGAADHSITILRERLQ
jgi:hypothetical protein